MYGEKSREIVHRRLSSKSVYNISNKNFIYEIQQSYKYMKC